MALVEGDEAAIEEAEWVARSTGRLPYQDADFIDLHVETVGVSNVPKTLLEWAALGTLAGLIQDRIGVKLYPDAESMSLAQFVVLIAPSGAGKGRAIQKMLELVSDTFIKSYLPDGTIEWNGVDETAWGVNERTYLGLHVYSGTLTRAGAQDLLVAQIDPQTGCKGHAKLWWIAEELSYCFGAIAHANETIKQLVAWKEKSVMAHQAKIRKDDKHLYIKDPCINMLAASTWDWMGQVMTKQDATGGLLRRTRYIEASYDITKKTLDEKEVPDAAVRKASMRNRIFGYAQIKTPDGVIHWGPGSKAAFREWFEAGLPLVPTDPAQYTLHSNRESEVAKLAALSAISGWDTRAVGPWPLIRPRDVTRAIRWWEQAYETAPKLWLHTSGGEAAQKMQMVVNVLEVLAKQCEGVVPEMLLARTLSSQSFVKRDVDDAVQTLLQQGVVRREFANGKWALLWQGR